MQRKSSLTKAGSQKKDPPPIPIGTLACGCLFGPPYRVKEAEQYSLEDIFYYDGEKWVKLKDVLESLET